MTRRPIVIALCACGVAVGACTHSLRAAADGDIPPARPTLVVCAAVLGTLGNVIHEGRSDRDAGQARAGYRAYARKAAAVLGEPESRQAIGSSFAFYDSLTPAQLERAADICLEAVDREFGPEDWW